MPAVGSSIGLPFRTMVPFTPPPPTAWWKFKDAIYDTGTGAQPTIGQTITRVPDRSGNGHHLNQVTANQMPTYRYFNGTDASDGYAGNFATGVNNNMTALLGTMNTVKTIYMMANIIGGQTQQMPFRFLNSSAVWVNHFATWYNEGSFGAFTIRPTGSHEMAMLPASSAPGVPGAWCVNSAHPIAVVYAANMTNAKVYFDSDTPIPLKYAGGANVTPINEETNVSIGGIAGGLQGAVREILVYDGAHDHATVLKIRNYLRRAR